MYQVGYFEGTANEFFQTLKVFITQSEAQEYVEIHYLRNSLGLPQNVAILCKRKIVWDGRWVSLN